MSYQNRTQAGIILGQELKKRFGEVKNAVVLGLPRGGVVVAKEVAQILNLPLDIIITRKIGAEENPEFAIGAVSEHLEFKTPYAMDDSYFNKQAIKERQEIERRKKLYRGSKPNLPFEGRIAFLIDDGLATGLTMEVACKEIHLQRPNKIIVAVPVAPPDTVAKIKRFADEIVVLQIEENFLAVGQFYEEFEQVSDEEVIRILN